MSDTTVASSVGGPARHGGQRQLSPVTRSTALAALLLCLAFFGGALIGLQLHFPASLVYFIWPPSVVVFVALALSPPRLWWVYFIALLPVHMLVEWWTVAAPPSSIALFYAVVWAQALVGALIMYWLVARPIHLNDLRTLIVFLLAAAAAALAEALTLTFVLVLSAPGIDVSLTLEQTFLADSLTMLILAPALLIAGSSAMRTWRSVVLETGEGTWRAMARSSMANRLSRVSGARVLEACLLSLGLLGVGLAAFGGFLSLPSTLPALLYGVLPLLLWATIRFGLSGTTLSLCGLCLLSILFAIHGRGPFSTLTATEDLISLQLFFIAVSVPMLVLAVIMHERQHAQAQLQQSEERYRAVVSNFPHGAVLLYGPDLRHLFADGQGLPQAGLSKESIEGRTLWEAFPADMADALEQHYRAALSGSSASFELMHQGRTYQTQVVPVQYTAAPTGMVVMQDVTEHRRAELLAELDRAKTAFFSNVSHEFRTPLTLLLGPAADALADHDAPLAGQQRERLELIQRNGLRLHKLVNSLLDVARIEAGNMQASYVLTDLAMHTSDLASTFRSAIERAGLRLTVHCDPPSQWAYVDRDMWEKIVLNLLSNALKFTFDGEITVTQLLKGEQIELQVHDTGTGIPAAELPHVFERFRRVPQTRARTQEGTGIGLALVQELTHLHGGVVEAASEEGMGSTFTVRIPSGGAQARRERAEEVDPIAPPVHGVQPLVEEAQHWVRATTERADALSKVVAAPVETTDVESRLAPSAVAQRSSRGGVPIFRQDSAGARILIADDNLDMRQYLARLLSAHWTVEEAGNGTDALARMRECAPDLVLADVMMPGLDGFALLRAVRSDPSTAACPVMLLSARAGEESIIEGLEAGADDYLVKPFAAGELVARVRTHLELAYLRRQALLRARQLEATIQAMTEGVFVCDVRGVLLQTNTTGRTLLDLLREDDASRPTPHDRDRLLPTATRSDEMPLPLQSPLKGLLRGEVLTEDTALNLEIHTRDGQDRTMHVTGSPVRDAHGQITAAVAVCRDITELKRTQDALSRQERSYRTLVEHHPDMISRFDRSHRRIYTNARISAFLGGVSVQLIGTTYRDLGFSDELTDAWDSKLKRVFESGKPLTYETDVLTPGGARTVQVRLAPELATDGQVESVLSIGTDITERKQAEKALRRAKESAEVARSEAEVAKRHEEQRREEADRRRRVAESLRAVVAILNSQQALDDVLDYIVEQAASVLGSQAAAIYRVPATPAGVVLLSTHGISEPPLMEAYLPARSAAMRRMLKERGAIALSDTTRVRAMRLGAGDQTKASAAPFVVPLDSSFRAVLAGPIVVGGESYGGLALLFQKPRSFTADECELASMLCDQVALAIENANLRDKAMQASVLAERARIARELHDAVTQTLFTASLVASALPNIWGRDPDAGRQGVENLRSLTRTALAEMRTLLVELRPAALSEKPLGDLLQQLSEAMSARVQAPIAIEVAPDAAEELPAHVQVAFYRIAQEALNNISKYARARHVLIQLRTIGGRLVMRVRDDGVGFVVARSSNGDSQARIQTRAQQGEGHAHAGGITVESAGPVAVNGAGVSGSGHSGITIMRERARSIGASFALRTRPGCGTLLVARWPGSEGSKDNATADGSYELSKTK